MRSKLARSGQRKVATHCIGDKALEVTLDAVEYCLEQGRRPDIRRDMVLFSLQYESRAMLCYESDIVAFHIDGLKKFELKGVKPQPFVLMEIKGDKKPEFQRRMKSYLLTKVYR